jgi:hypothetical protein
MYNTVQFYIQVTILHYVKKAHEIITDENKICLISFGRNIYHLKMVRKLYDCGILLRVTVILCCNLTATNDKCKT